MSISQASVFDKFTFFGVLVPGIFASALLFPFLPSSLTGPLLGVILYLVVVSFILGMFFNGLGEPLENLSDRKWWLSDSVTIFSSMINDSKIPMARNQSVIDKALVRECLDELGDILNLDKSTIEKLKSGEEYDREEMTAIYQYTLNQVWASGGSPAKIHHSVRMLCRSLAAACIGVFTFSSLIVIIQSIGFLPYVPVYVTRIRWLGHIGILLTYFFGLLMIGAAAVYIHRQYTHYQCMYMLSDFLRENR